MVKIFETKERPRFDPLIVHLPELEWLERLAVVEDEARALIEKLIVCFLARAPHDRASREAISSHRSSPRGSRRSRFE